jgi:Flavin containing amine oxidoreductase
MTFQYDMDQGLQDGLEIDVAIVGAGVSGLYSGWRLRVGEFAEKTQFPQPPVTHVFELNNRLGGRLVTAFLDGMPHVRCELGGMRYIKATPTAANPLPGQQMVDRLGAKLGLTSIPFPMGDGNTLYYLRRRRCRVKDIQAGFLLPYGLEAWEQRRSDDDLFTAIINDILKRADEVQPQNRRDWNALKTRLTFQGRPTYALGFWNVLSCYLSNEGYSYLQDVNGYDSNTMNWNAGEAMQAQIGDFGADTTYNTFQEGFDALAHGTAQLFCAAGGKIWAENGLVTFSREVRDGEPWLNLQFFNKTQGKYWNVYARKLVLAMPRRSLELCDQTNFFFNDRQRARNERLAPYIQSAIIQPAFKLYLGYSRPWWREFTPTFSSGRTITDMPTRQVFYFGTECEQPGGEKGNTNSLLMASYTDEWASDFWRPLEEDEPWFPRGEAMALREVAAPFSGPRRRTGFTPRDAPRLLVEQSQKQIREIHGNQIAIPDPYVSAFYDWGDDPYGGGYHAWGGGYQVPAPWTVAKRMRRPFDDVPVHICGEAYSDQQAWVEGALCTAELMLQEHFGMQYPTDWLPAGYYLGW